MVVPCFNEEQRWNAGYWAAMLATEGTDWLFVDDGSTDATPSLIAQTISAHGGALLRLDRNAGKAEAVRQGLLRAFRTEPRVEIAGFMDADGAFNAQDVSALVEICRDRLANKGDAAPDAVWSSRVALAGRDIRRSTRRHYLGRAVATFVSLGQPEIPYDTQSGLKLFRRSRKLDGVLAVPFETRWLFELEMMARWSEQGSPMRIWEEPVDYWHDVPGSKITGREVWRVASEIAALKRIQRRAIRRSHVG